MLAPITAAEARSSLEFPPRNTVMKMADPDGVQKEGYYGLPMLKRPLWGWEIAVYFFSEGISAGSFVLSTMADLTGDDRYGALVRRGRLLSLATLIPCPPLLIADLGRPERFHHMLRIVKRSSPMNIGAWALTGYGQATAMVAASAATEWLPAWAAAIAARLPARLLSILGLPFAFTMIAYPGVLLSTTSTPMWSHTRLLGALFSASSMSTACAALSLANRGGEGAAALHRVETIATVCESAALAGYLVTAGDTAKPLLRGRYGWQVWAGVVGAGLALPLAISTGYAAAGRPRSRRAGVMSAIASLAGGLMLKWAVVHAGRESALDSHAARYATRATAKDSGWVGPPKE